jgi:fructokinase
MNQTIGIFGEILFDVFTDHTVLGGAPFNVARHLSLFSEQPIFVTRAGEDRLKSKVIEAFEYNQLNAIGLQFDPQRQTGQVNVTLTNGQPSYAILEDQAYDHIHAGITHLVMMSMRPSIKYFGTLAQRSPTSRLALDHFLCDKPCPVFLDLNLRDPWYTQATIEYSLLNCHFAKMNAQEFSMITKMLALKGDDDYARAKELLINFELTELIITRGEQGCWMMDEEFNVREQMAEPLKSSLMDTVGAGDAFSAVYLLGKLNAWPAATTLQRANRFASAICCVSGAAPDSLSFYQPFIEAWSLNKSD